MDLSVLIPARNEMFLARTVDDVLANARGDTEVIAVCDGQWADPPLKAHPRLQVIRTPESIGQRAATNLAARLSTARFIMKLDAHCSVAEGFDVTLMAECERDWTVIPRMYNLHAFDWVCVGCGDRRYQGPTPTECDKCGTHLFQREMKWEPRMNRRTDFARFDSALHFQYWRDYEKRAEAAGDIADVMSSVGACWFMMRERFWELGGLDEGHGSWGQMGTEIACKSWLSGGRQVVNKRTWFAHMFRTQGGDFGFPYHLSQQQVEKARARSRHLWLEGGWEGTRRPLSWLIQKFAPVPDWDTLPATRPAPAVPAPRSARATRGLVYYTDNRVEPRIGAAVLRQLSATRNGWPMAVVSLAPVAFAGGRPNDRQIVFDEPRGYLTMFRQILAGLEALNTDLAFLVEHDVLYHPSHFDFEPPDAERFWYNQNTWKVDAETGRALFYRCCQTSGLAADRSLLLRHYRLRVEHVQREGFSRNLGFEPGTNHRSRALDPHGAGTWMAAYPNVDIRHGRNLTRSRWTQAEFRNKNSCLGWTEADEVPGWGRTRGRFWDFLRDAIAVE